MKQNMSTTRNRSVTLFQWKSPYHQGIACPPWTPPHHQPPPVYPWSPSSRGPSVLSGMTGWLWRRGLWQWRRSHLKTGQTEPLPSLGIVELYRGHVVTPCAATSGHHQTRPTVDVCLNKNTCFNTSQCCSIISPLHRHASSALLSVW